MVSSLRWWIGVDIIIYNNCSLCTIFYPRTPSLQRQALSHLVLRCYKWLMLHKGGLHTGEPQGYPIYSKWRRNLYKASQHHIYIQSQWTCVHLIRKSEICHWLWHYCNDNCIMPFYSASCNYYYISFHHQCSPTRVVWCTICILYCINCHIIYIYMYRETAWYHAVLYNMHINYHGTFSSYVVCANKWWHQYIVLHKLRIETQHA